MQPWPEHEERFLIEDEVEIPVQINGKLRDTVTVKKHAGADEIVAAARARAKVIEHLAGREVRKHIVIPGKLINFVV